MEVFIFSYRSLKTYDCIDKNAFFIYIRCVLNQFVPTQLVSNLIRLRLIGFPMRFSGSVFATTGIVSLFRGLQKSENAARGQKMLFQDGH
jgi:hypothetical protein